jgi:hypothetical protein
MHYFPAPAAARPRSIPVTIRRAAPVPGPIPRAAPIPGSPPIRDLFPSATSAGGRTCLCNTGPKCRHDHRLKQYPKWHVAQLPDGTFTWTTPAGRTYTTEPTRYPI